MSAKYLLVGVLASISPLLSGSTVVTATSSCQVLHFGSPDPLFTQSESVTFTTNDVSGQINGLDCVTPFGSVIYNLSPGETFFESSINVSSGGFMTATHSALGGAANIVGVDLMRMDQVGLTSSAHIHVSTQETVIATGGTGIGALEGGSNGFFDYFSLSPSFSNLSLSITTPFGGCPPTCTDTPQVPFSFQFIFGQPFTIDLESDLAFGTVLGQAGGVSVLGTFIAGAPAVFDVNGNPIPGVVFTPVPEPGSAFLAGAALLFGAVFVARFSPYRDK